MKREDILAVYQAGPEAVVELVTTLIAEFTQRIIVLEERVRYLENQLKQNSRNSNKPPSSDGFKKPKVQREKGDRPAGGQKGHTGHTLKMVDTPDCVKVHQVSTCRQCGHSLTEVPAKSHERRQVFDLPPLKVEVTEHRAEIKRCLQCGCLNKGTFPEDVRLPVQYGPGLKAVAVYLNQYQLLPYERTSEIFADLFGHHLSQGTLVNTNQACYEAVEAVEQKIKELLAASPTINCDETGTNADGKKQWLHVAGTERLTCYSVHPKRGYEATYDMGILPGFTGKVVHDHWKPYFKYPCDHSLCNAHHLRELTGAIERDNQHWPQMMIELLLEIKKTVDEKRPTTDHLNPIEIKTFEEKYDAIIQKGLAENQPRIIWFKSINDNRNGKKQSKTKNLLDRLDNYRRETLAFMYDFRVPFDNNQAERDLRMVKVQQKISGTFRSSQGAKIFCRIRGYISTVKKNGLSIIDALQSAFKGSPLFPVSVDP